MNKNEALKKINETNEFYLNADQKIIARKIIEAVIDEDTIDDYLRIIFKYNSLGFKFEPSGEKDSNFINIAIENKAKNINIESDASDNENMLLIGNCFSALKNLEITYRENIELIFLHLMQLKNENLEHKEDFFKTDGWLKYIQIKLRLAKDLLSKKGFIFIVVNYIEQPYLKILSDEIFGESNFKGCFPVPNHDMINFDYVLMYSKGQILQKIKSTAGDRYSKNDNDGRGFYHTASSLVASSSQKYSVNTDFPVELNGKTFLPILNNKRWHWKWNKERMRKAKELNLLFATENQLYYKAYFNYEFQKRTNELIEKTKEMSISSLKFVNNYYQNSAKNLNNIDNSKVYFENSLSLIKELIKLQQNPNSLILDMGDKNGIVGSAVISTNLEDGANRKFILNKCECETQAYESDVLLKEWFENSYTTDNANPLKLRVFDLINFDVSLNAKKIFENQESKFKKNLQLLNKNYKQEKSDFYFDLLKLKPFEKK